MREDLTEMSTSCEISSSEQRLEEEDHEALLRKLETMKSKLERLQLVNERLHGEGIYGLSFSELNSLESQLNQGLLSVIDELAKKTIELQEDERLAMQEANEDENMGRERIMKRRDDKLNWQFVLSNNRKILRNKARELRISSEEKQHEHDHETLLGSIESMDSEIKRSQLLNERMCGKELKGLNYFELMILRREMQYGLLNVTGRKFEKKLEEYARRCEEEEMRKRDSEQMVPVANHEQSSLDNGTDDEDQSNISLRLRSLEML